jgi:U4/U6.U5 tri-snRNP component SNU23
MYQSSLTLNYRDNIQYVEHLNSKQHLVATGQSGEVRRATVEEVRERLRYLRRKREEDKFQEVIDLDTRLALNKEQLEQEAEARRQKRNEKRRAKKNGDSTAMEWKVEGDGIIS